MIRKSHSRGKHGQGACSSCGVQTPKFNQARCRCCAADEDPFNRVLGGDTLASGELMAPAPIWPRGIGKFPRLETASSGSRLVALWWMPKGSNWIPQHPLEYPRNLLKDLPASSEKRTDEGGVAF